MQRLHLLIAGFFVLGVFLTPRFIMAQSPKPSPTIEVSITDLEATGAAEASASAEATSAARLVVERVTEKRPDITQPEGEIQGRLERILLAQEVTPLSWHNFLQHAIRQAVLLKVPANTVVLILLFPVVAAIIAAARHLIGLRGFGIFVPAVLSVAFVATGIVVGILLFMIILVVATLAQRVLRRLKLQYLPRMALLLWFVSVGVLVALLLAPSLGIEALVAISIFPILILMLLAENFIEVQIGKSRKEAMELTVETIILALICSLFLSLETLQRFAILHPELLLLLVAAFDVFVGRYVGLRYNEYKKFKKIVGK
jgi:hypothetical protein